MPRYDGADGVLLLCSVREDGARPEGLLRPADEARMKDARFLCRRGPRALGVVVLGRVTRLLAERRSPRENRARMDQPWGSCGLPTPIPAPA